jgi:serine/threonine protein phosphatase PrpC
LRNAALRAGAEWRDDILGLARLETEACAKDILSAAFRSCHEAARQRGKRGGTTALVFWSCLVGGRKIGFCANAGDSRAVLSVDGSARRLSVDHTADVPDEVKRVERVGGKVSLGLLADPLDGDAELKVTRGLGNFNLEPGFTPQPHVSGAIDLTTANFEFVILASDGLWDKVSDEEAVTLARNKLLSSWSPQQVAHALAHAAAERGSTDDTSVIIYSLAPKFAAAARASALSCGATRSASLEALAAGGVALGEAGSSNDSGFVSPQQAASCAVYSPPLQVCMSFA